MGSPGRAKTAEEALKSFVEITNATIRDLVAARDRAHQDALRRQEWRRKVGLIPPLP